MQQRPVTGSQGAASPGALPCRQQAPLRLRPLLAARAPQACGARLASTRLRSVAAAAAPSGSYDVDSLDVDSLRIEDPFGLVGDVMTTTNLRAATPTQPLSAAASKLDKVTGLAVVDESNKVVGVISIKVRPAEATPGALHPTSVCWAVACTARPARAAHARTLARGSQGPEPRHPSAPKSTTLK